MKVAVIGSRTFDNYSTLVDILKDFEISTIISGGAKGADTLAELYAFEHNIRTMILKADWKRYGKSAGMVRNKDIINNCDMVVTFWDGVSKGTNNSIGLALNQNKDLIIVLVSESGQPIEIYDNRVKSGFF